MSIVLGIVHPSTSGFKLHLNKVSLKPAAAHIACFATSGGATACLSDHIPCWMPKDSIPAEGDLATTYELSIGTVRQAVDCLAAERLLERGRGTYVRRARSNSSLLRASSVCSRKPRSGAFNRPAFCNAKSLPRLRPRPLRFESRKIRRSSICRGCASSRMNLRRAVCCPVDRRRDLSSSMTALGFVRIRR